MKRSAQVSLVLMAAAGIGAAAYAMTSNDNCRQPPPNTVPRETQPNAALRMAPQDCRSSRGGPSGRGSSFFSSSSGSSGSGTSAANATPASTSASTSTGRGGFGAIGRAFASFSGGG